ncbi:MAG TPA: hypothetical protein VNS79_01765 [Sphingobium sp.]|nr:hypothetical protein [Sphingobium sp.]
MTAKVPFLCGARALGWRGVAGGHQQAVVTEISSSSHARVNRQLLSERVDYLPLEKGSSDAERNKNFT